MTIENGTASRASRGFNTGEVIPLWLDGKEVTTSLTFGVVSPVENKAIWKSSAVAEEDVQRAIFSAEEAFRSWSKTKPSTRRDIFLRAAEEMRKRRDEAREISYNETGASMAMFGFEFEASCQMLLSIAGLIEPATTSSVPVLETDEMRAMVVKEPFGVVLAIAPWNAPHVLGIRACIQPLAMGNTVILKAPESSPATYWNLVDVLHKAGLPAGCLNTVVHRPADAAKITSSLIAHPAIKKISFTGSTNVGAIIASQAGKYLKPTVMELGGKAPSIVCDDADIEKAALQCCLGAFLHAGQVCMATERIIVHKKVADDFRVALSTTTEQLFGASGNNIPQLVAEAGVKKNALLLEDALAKGARLLVGNTKDTESSKTQMKPAVIENVNPDMDLYHVESFGPTVSLYVVGSDEEAIELANDTEYGLSSAVFTEDLRRGLKIARALETGAVHINTMTIHDEACLPHGGVKKSGYGRFNGISGLDEWVRSKVVTWLD